MTKCGLLFDERYRRHHTGVGHPERPQRLDAIQAGLEARGLFAQCERILPALAGERRLLRVHSSSYLARFRSACQQGWPYQDTPDCPISPDSCEVAMLAAGGVNKAARLVAEGKLQRAFCAVRPPGHHAEMAEAMGFCIYNNVAIAARTLQDEFGIERVAIIDFDVHHGNGTQHIFETDPSVLFVSTHGDPAQFYPHMGFADECGSGAGVGCTLNVPLAPGTDDATYRAAFEAEVIPAIEAFRPQVLLASAGFDAHRDDPLGIFDLTDDTFAWITDQLVALADRHCNGKLVSVLEGGYNLDVLERCVAEHVARLCE